ncbi:MAG: hypothetical protein ACF8CQ_16825 [Rhodopirellula sp. JB044]|uniref:hypothetical protein n=1 Tax=Rhodopirellula sp. JB044 TaxID=3342844 RepID=UPI00370B27C5
MSRIYVTLVLLVAGMMVGCGGGQSEVPFDQSELDKHVEEHPVPLVTDDDFRMADDAGVE